jgi:hypothetical protein
MPCRYGFIRPDGVNAPGDRDAARIVAVRLVDLRF